MADHSQYVIFDGSLQRSDEPAAPVTSRGLMYGDGCFETLRSYSGGLLKLNEHLKRLKKGLNYLNIPYPNDLQPTSLKKQIKSLLQKNELIETDGIIRLQVWRSGNRGYKIPEPGESRYSITTTKLAEPKEAYKLATVSTKRVPSTSVPAKYKLTNGLNFIIAASQASQKNADDALMETIDNYISETTIANVFWLKDEVIYTPSTECDILPGVTRSIVLKLVRESLNIELRAGTFTVEEVKKADRVWICNSVKEIAPVCAIDDRRFETGGPLLDKLKGEFQRFRDNHLA